MDPAHQAGDPVMSNQPLFTPYRMGDLDLPNRIVMAPLTRMRAQSQDHVPTTLQAEDYAQRASAGLIITEATAISPEGFGWADTPGLWTDEQVRGWRRVTDAVHAAGGRIISQLWHTGAISHPELLAGAQPVNSQEVEQAMPLDQFINETLDVLATDADEILVEPAKPLRANPGREEHALVKGFNQQMLKLFGSSQA